MLGSQLTLISIHSPHAGRDQLCLLFDITEGISIHSPHAGRDTMCNMVDKKRNKISIHSPHAGRDASFSTEKQEY